MRAIYIFILLFLAWCVICARWYIFSVKGLLLDPVHFNPHETTTAIVEILFMVLVAFLLGFAIAWLLRETSVRKTESMIRNIVAEKSTLMSLNAEQKDQLEQSKVDLVQIREEALEVARENQKLKTEQEIAKTDNAQIESELAMVRTKVQESETELQLLKFRLKQSEQLVVEQSKVSQKQLEERENNKTDRRYEQKEPVFSDFIKDQQQAGISQVDENEKDDLKAIGGIGPGIEKKLNSLGINSFRQISELTEESVNGISDAVKFFPGRIQRDRWVEQASVLYLQKLRR